VVWRPQTPAFTVPYAVVIVTFGEGFQLLTNLVHATVAEVRTGLRVRTVFHGLGAVTLPCAEPDRS
jgi:uncharacterized OB-fold protein